MLRTNTGLMEQDKPEYVVDAGKSDFLYGEMAESPEYTRKGKFLKRGEGKKSSSLGAYQAKVANDKVKR